MRCYNKAYWRLSVEARLAELADRRCAGCDAPIPPERHRNMKYCSPACRSQNATDAQRLVMRKTCPQCGILFRVWRQEQVFCSLACAGLAARSLPDRRCAHCGGEFHPVNMVQRFCSKACVTKARWAEGRIKPPKKLHWLTAERFDRLLDYSAG